MVGPIGQASKQASIDTYTCVQCSHASVGLAQARPNYSCSIGKRITDQGVSLSDSSTSAASVIPGAYEPSWSSLTPGNT